MNKKFLQITLLGLSIFFCVSSRASDSVCIVGNQPPVDCDQLLGESHGGVHGITPDFVTSGAKIYGTKLYVPYYVNTNLVAVDTNFDGVRAALNRAATTWKTAGNSGLEFFEAGIDTSPYPQVARDGKNMIFMAQSCPGSIIALTTNFMHQDGTGYVIDESDTYFCQESGTTTLTWQASGSVLIPPRRDLETSALHEMGHVAGLAHSNISTAVMSASNLATTIKRNLTNDDSSGIQSLYGIIQPGEGFQSNKSIVNSNDYAMVTANFGAANAGLPYLVFVVVGGIGAPQPVSYFSLSPTINTSKVIPNTSLGTINDLAAPNAGLLDASGSALIFLPIPQIGLSSPLDVQLNLFMVVFDAQAIDGFGLITPALSIIAHLT